MKKIIALFAVISLAGCASFTPIQPQTIPQVAEQVCPSIQSVIVSLQSPGVLLPADSAKLAAAQPKVAAVCMSAQTAKPLDVQNLAAQGVPVLLTMISNSSLTAQAKQNATVAVIIAQAALAPVIQQSIAAHNAIDPDASAAK